MKTLIQPSNSKQISKKHVGKSVLTRGEKQSSRLCSSGTPVKIKKGAFRGCTGKISACTLDGVYFIQQNVDCQHNSCGRMPEGPFLAEEFERID